MIIRPYDPGRDAEACKAVWREICWLPDTPRGIQATEAYFAANPCLVTEVEGRAEAVAVAESGTLRHLEERLPFWAVTAVTVGYTGRKRGLGSRITAEITALGARNGFVLAGLGIFEQGYYNRIGYGNGPYNRRVAFRPSDLPGTLPYPARPCRVSVDDLDHVVACVEGRMPCHGQITLSRNFLKAEMLWEDKGFGLGIRNPGGDLTGFLWFQGPPGEHGPYRVACMAYRGPRELMELLGMLRSMGDQVDRISMEEPPHIQFQDLMTTPLRDFRTFREGRDPVGTRCLSYAQARFLDVPKALERTVIPWGRAEFNLTLTDPIAGLLPDDAPWKGCAGEYTVVLGPESQATPGLTPGLPGMRAGVGAFTRLWLGVRHPSVLSLTDELEAPESLLIALDRLLPLPEPRFNCDF